LVSFGPLGAADKETKKGAKEVDKVYPVAVFPFVERGREVASMGGKVSDLLFAKLIVNPELFLVERENLATLLAEQELNLSGLVNPAEATKVGQLTGAKILVTGSVLQVDNDLYLVAKVIGTETSRVLGASVKGKIRDPLDKLAEDLAGQIIKTIGERADQLVAKPVTHEDRLASLKDKLGKGKRPVVMVEVRERHTGQVAVLFQRPAVEAVVEVAPRPAGQIILDPAAETELILFCKELGFEVIDPAEGNRKEADVIISGEGLSQFATRHGNLMSVKARLEVKAVDRKTGQVVAIDRQTTVAVDTTEQIAAKTALQEASAQIAERLLPKLVQPEDGKKADKGKKGTK
jgi:TolB-like protein